jgi:hypothetical protein
MGRVATVALLLLASCGASTPATVALTEGGASDTHADGASAAGLCRHAAGVDDGGPGACRVGMHSLRCTESDVTCLCVTDGDSCNQCAASTCHDVCNADEYALVCGGLPTPDAPFDYASAPDGCRSLGVTPGGSEFFCCPCR